MEISQLQWNKNSNYFFNVSWIILSYLRPQFRLLVSIQSQECKRCSTRCHLILPAIDLTFQRFTFSPDVLREVFNMSICLMSARKFSSLRRQHPDCQQKGEKMCLVPTRLNLTLNLSAHSDCLNVKVGDLSDSNNKTQSNNTRKIMFLSFQWVRPNRNPDQQHNQSEAEINNKLCWWWSIRPVKMILQSGSCRLSPSGCCAGGQQMGTRWERWAFIVS